ncbi:T9SS type A sorting domain-containing protein, partial [candidate division KSB1 bacterium]|nr:T9SS type A sorting domain-containing protein [candidate division KSB1 bacterium]
PKAGLVRMTVYNILGEEVETLIDENCQKGENIARWTANGVSSGTYFIRLNFENINETQKVLLQK